MKRKMMPVSLFSAVTAFIAMALLIPPAVRAADMSLTSDGKVPGQPFQYLQDQLTDLQGRVAALERVDPQSFSLTCGSSTTITDAVKFLRPGDTLLVSGACSENVVISEEVRRITLDGQGSAVINGPDPDRSAVQVRGRDITVKDFTITGGETGILVTRGGTALINGNTIQSVGTTGVNVNENSSARIINNTIQNNPTNGISVGDGSSARIGFLDADDTVASPNIIQGNGAEGINVFRSSTARIVGNTISNNGQNGVIVNRASHADISSNTINGNASSGINVLRNSGVDLGADSGTGIFESPNRTTVNNSVNGIRCSINSYADRRLGTLNGAAGAKSFAVAEGCIDSLNP